MSRDVLAPPTQRMSHNRNYRVNAVHDDFGGNKWKAGNQRKTRGYEEPDLYADDDFAENDDECCIEELPTGTFRLALHVPKVLFGGIIGFRGNTKRRIESETESEIQVPHQTDTSNEIIITSNQRTNVCSALRKIRSIMHSLRRRMKPTHFLALPLNIPGDVLDKFLKLKQEILDAQFPGIDPEFFISERCIHITLGIFVLLDDIDRENAVKELQQCRQYLEGLTTPIELKINRLEIMNDDPSATRVLYAGVESPELQQFADKCLQHFQTKGLCAKDNNERDSIKLHMTVLNSKYRERNDNDNGSAKNKDKYFFDAREILKRFGDYDFGTVKCNLVHLCVMKSSQEVDDFYKITGTLNF